MVERQIIPTFCRISVLLIWETDLMEFFRHVKYESEEAAKQTKRDHFFDASHHFTNFVRVVILFAKLGNALVKAEFIVFQT